jgi:lantibiotic leader peptide-processing serine protease
MGTRGLRVERLKPATVHPRAPSDLTAYALPRTFDNMMNIWGDSGRRATRACRRLVLGVAAASTTVLGACSDMGPAVPHAIHASNAVLPAAARYLVALRGTGLPSAALTAQIRAAGGRIVYTHAGSGLVMVAGLSATSATALRRRTDVETVIADVHQIRIHDPAFARWAGRPLTTLPHAGPHAAGLTGRSVDPRTAAAFSMQWNMTQIHADSAWQITSQGAGEKVFILDSGVDTAHTELVGHVNTALSTSFVFAPTDTVDTLPLPFGHDVAGHGTFVSSLITGNSVVLAAVAPQSQIVMVRVLDDAGQGSFLGSLQGILYATDNGANVINMSLGGFFNRTNSDDLAFVDVLQRVVDYAFQRGILIVAASGNDGVDFNTATGPTGSYVDSLETPAGLHHVLSVGATGPVNKANFNTIAVYSNFGADGVGVFAPGGNTVDTVQADLVIGACSSATTSLCPGMEGQYLIGAGTSFASPMTAAEGAVIQGQSSTVVGQVLETCIENSAFNVTGKRPDPSYNFGVIDVLAAVNSKGCH